VDKLLKKIFIFTLTIPFAMQCKIGTPSADNNEEDSSMESLDNMDNTHSPSVINNGLSMTKTGPTTGTPSATPTAHSQPPMASSPTTSSLQCNSKCFQLFPKSEDNTATEGVSNATRRQQCLDDTISAACNPNGFQCTMNCQTTYGADSSKLGACLSFTLLEGCLAQVGLNDCSVNCDAMYAGPMNTQCHQFVTNPDMCPSNVPNSTSGPM